LPLLPSVVQMRRRPRSSPFPYTTLFRSLEWDIKLDAMITDVVLPGRNGRELADVAKSIRPDLTVLYVSGYTDDVMLHHKLLEHGAVLVHKPFTPDVLIKRLRELLDARTRA